MQQSTRTSAAGWIAFVAFLVVTSPAAALPIEASVGTGDDTAYIQIEFSPTGNFLFEVAFTDDGTVSGLDLLQTLETELVALSLVITSFPFGDLLDGITYGASSNIGFVAPEGYWHYWTKEAESDPWGFASSGAADRRMSDGSFDGWRYGSGAPPTPEPGTGVLAGLGLAALAARRRRQARSPRGA